MGKQINTNLGLLLKDLRRQGLLTSCHRLSPDCNKTPHSVDVNVHEKSLSLFEQLAHHKNPNFTF